MPRKKTVSASVQNASADAVVQKEELIIPKPTKPKNKYATVKSQVYKYGAPSVTERVCGTVNPGRYIVEGEYTSGRIVFYKLRNIGYIRKDAFVTID